MLASDYQRILTAYAMRLNDDPNMVRRSTVPFAPELSVWKVDRGTDRLTTTETRRSARTDVDIMMVCESEGIETIATTRQTHPYYFTGLLSKLVTPYDMLFSMIYLAKLLRLPEFNHYADMIQDGPEFEAHLAMERLA